MKKLFLILLASISINLNAQSLNDVKETSASVKEAVTSISKTTPKVVKAVKEQAKEVTEQVPGVVSQVGGAIKTGVNTVVTGAKDVTNFVDTSSNFRWMLNKTNDFVVSAAQSLKVGAEKVLYIMAKKYFLMGIYAWISVIGMSILAIFLYNKGMSNMNSIVKDGNPLPIFTLVMSCVLVFLAYTNLQDAINYTFNPEYYVLQELKDFVINIVK